jgi:spermidine synthase
VEVELWGVEIDRKAIALGREWFDLPEDSERVHVIAGDARTALARLPAGFDLIVLDTYANQVEIPAHLATVELFTRAREHLAPGGWLAMNVGGFGAADPVVDAVGRTLVHVFGGARVAGARVPSSRNWVLFARRDAEVPSPDAPGWRVPGPVGEALIPPLELPGAWVGFRDAGPFLTDDRSPMERLQRQSLEEGRERLAAH